MNESTLRRALLVTAILGLAFGIGVWRTGLGPLEADTIWTLATLPVVAALALSILRDFWIGRFGVDAIALVSMSAALLLGQPLAAVVVTTTHTAKDGSPKIVDAATYPLTAQRPVDVVVTEAATFRVRDGGLVLVEVADGVALDWVHAHTTAPFTVALEEAVHA